MFNIDDFGTIINLVLLFTTYMILQPLKASIKDLKSSIDNNVEAVNQLQNMLTTVRIDLAKLEQECKSAHHRINELTEKLEDLRNQCINCQRKG